MTQEIRDRVEQIRHGNVPEGYVKSEAGIIPVSWQCKSISSSLRIKNNERKPISEEVRQTIPGPYPYYGPTQAQGYISTYESEGPAVLIGEDGDHFLKYRSKPMTLLVDGKYTVNNHAHMICGTEICNARWFYYVYEFKPLLNAITRQGAGRYKLTKDALEKLPIQLPSSDEQKQIAEILTTQDKVIELKEKRLAEKQRQKKYLMQQLLTGKKRLPGFDEEWETAPIGKFLESRNTKQMPSDEAPLMAFVAGEGVTSKGDKYDRSHLVKEDIKKYKRTELNDFIYSSNNLDVGSIGLNKYGTAVISVVYEVFKAKEKVEPVVISEIIQLLRNLHHILSYRQGAFYGQYRIFSEDFLSIPIKVPCYEEQLAIGVVLNAADKEIELLRQDLEQEKQKKKALMQLLLTGIVRV